MQAPGGFFVSARLQAAAISLFLIVPLGGVAAVPAAAQTPAQVGQWEGPLTWPWVSIHMMLLPNGQVLFWDGPPEDGGQTATLWNPATGGFTPAPNTVTNIFCVGQAFLADGRGFIAGGHLNPGVGLVDGNIFDGATGDLIRTNGLLS